MPTPPAVNIQSPIPTDQAGLGWTSQGWLPQMSAYQRSCSGVSQAVSAAVSIAGLEWYYPCYANNNNVQINLPAAAAQWQKAYVFKKTDNTSHTVTIAPNGVIPDTIDNNLTLVMTKQYETVYIISDGVSNWNVILHALPGLVTGVPSPTIYTSGSGNFTTSGTTTLIKVVLQAAGGNGGAAGNANTKNGGGGGAGEYAEFIIPVAASTNYAYSVGAVGATTTFTVGRVVYTVNFGVSAASVSVGSTGGGAGGGRSGPAGGAAGAGGVAGSAAVSEGALGEAGAQSGASGGGGTTNAADSGGVGGGSLTFPGGTTTVASGGGGASSFFGPGGNSGPTNTAGTNAVSTAYGAGGGGGSGGAGSFGGGTGTGGCIIIIPLN